MPKNPPDGMTRISSILFYKDLPAALEWLAKSFGFEKRMELAGPDGGIVHAEMTLRDGVIMMGPVSGERGCLSPSDLHGVNQSLYVYVEGLQAHFQRAKVSGAEITSEPEDMFWGDQVYSARDPEGHHWTFAEHVKDVPPEELRPPRA